jgi:hypothetical protein
MIYYRKDQSYTHWRTIQLKALRDYKLYRDIHNSDTIDDFVDEFKV